MSTDNKHDLKIGQTLWEVGVTWLGNIEQGSVTVTGVGRKYATLSNGLKLCLHTLRITDGGRYREHRCFFSESRFVSRQKAGQLKRKIANANFSETLPIAHIEQAAKLLGIDLDEPHDEIY